MINHDSIFALYPSIVTIRDEVAYDKDENIVEYDKAAVEAHAASKEYITKRAAEYPTIGDQLDALWKGGDAAAEMLAKVQAVKNKYPKGTE
jgi:vacuolar-type H+-ATPase subunit B/Vma2